MRHQRGWLAAVLALPVEGTLSGGVAAEPTRARGAAPRRRGPRGGRRDSWAQRAGPLLRRPRMTAEALQRVLKARMEGKKLAQVIAN